MLLSQPTHDLPQNVGILNLLFPQMLCLREENEADKKFLQDMKTTLREVPFPYHHDEHQVIDLILQEQLQLEEALLPQKVLVGVLE